MKPVKCFVTGWCELGSAAPELRFASAVPDPRTASGVPDAATAAAVAAAPDLLTDVTFVNKMRQLGEGRIGKLIRRKSGSMELKLGQHTLLLNAGTPVNFLQELVAMNDRENPNQLIKLGNVQEKYVLSPSMVHLLQDPPPDTAAKEEAE